MKLFGQKTSSENVEAQPGDLLLFTRARKLNRLITWFTQSKYYHVAIYEGENHVIESRPRGVVRRDLKGPDGDKSFVVIPAPGGREAGLRALEWAKQQLGTPYDPVGVFSLVVDRVFSCGCIPFNTKSLYSCGELVVKSFRETGHELFPGRNAEAIVPADFEQFLPPDPKKQRIRSGEEAAEGAAS
jgi:uncharacterized protein YycO